MSYFLWNCKFCKRVGHLDALSGRQPSFDISVKLSVCGRRSDVNTKSCLSKRADICRRFLTAVGTVWSASCFGQCASWLYVVTHSSCDLLLLMTLEAGRSRGPRVERGGPYLSWLSGPPLRTLGLRQKRIKKKNVAGRNIKCEMPDHHLRSLSCVASTW